MALTDRQRRFVEEYLVDLNATQAAIRAGYSKRTAASQGERLLRHVEVAAAVRAAQDARSKRTEVTQDRIVRELWGMAMADTNELVEHRRCCCRFCWGDGHRYQRTPNEMRLEMAAHLEAAAQADADGADSDPPPPFDREGGDGFNATRPPNPACPECFGEGHGQPVFLDSRTASPGARALYAGMKITKDGMEMKLHDKSRALELLGRHLGMFTDKLEVSGTVNLATRLAAARRRVKGDE